MAYNEFQKITKEEQQQDKTTEEQKPDNEENESVINSEPEETKCEIVNKPVHHEEPTRFIVNSILKNKNANGSINMRSYITNITRRA
jgi:hypothetical protein